MADINERKNKMLVLKKLERDRLVAQANIHSREIRILELEDEIERNKNDMINQRKIIDVVGNKIEEMKSQG